MNPKQKHRRFRLDDSGEFDEVCVKNAFVHIERMSESEFWGGIDPPKGSGLPEIMLFTGVTKGTWYFNVGEDCHDGSQHFSVRRPRKSRKAKK